jgi:hypothetical protein
MRLIAVLLGLTLSSAAQDAFYVFSIDEDHQTGAPDFSALNHPLTAVDRVLVKDGHFYTAGGQRVRMFGVNTAFGANFPEPADAARIAKRLRRLGINLVRLHHLDSSPDRQPEDARSTLTQDPYPTLNPVSIARLRGFLGALKAEGILRQSQPARRVSVPAGSRRGARAGADAEQAAAHSRNENGRFHAPPRYHLRAGPQCGIQQFTETGFRVLHGPGTHIDLR